MHHFAPKGGVLHAEDVPVPELAERFGTPLYVYSAATLRRHYRVFDAAFAGLDHLVCFAMKACSNLSVLQLLAREGSGFDVVSGGELHRVLLAGGDPARVVFSGVGKTDAEMRMALKAGIHCFNVESGEELELLARVAQDEGLVAPVSVRVNPDVDARTHPYVATGLRRNKFGVPFEAAHDLYRFAAGHPHLRVRGVDCHIGSQLTELEPFVDALDRVLTLVGELRARGIGIDHLDIGGGLGISYDKEAPPSPAEYAHALKERLRGTGLRLVLEPGRVIAGNAGILVTRVLVRKVNGDVRFVVVDAGMNDNLRPSLYGAFHAIVPVGPGVGERVVADVVGPICESGDFLAKDREIAWPEQGELLAVMSAGAYGFAMSSSYNSRPRAAEVLVDGAEARLIRRRETIDDLVKNEIDLVSYGIGPT